MSAKKYLLTLLLIFLPITSFAEDATYTTQCQPANQLAFRKITNYHYQATARPGWRVGSQSEDTETNTDFKLRGQFFTPGPNRISTLTCAYGNTLGSQLVLLETDTAANKEQLVSEKGDPAWLDGPVTENSLNDIREEDCRDPSQLSFTLVAENRYIANDAWGWTVTPDSEETTTNAGFLLQGAYFTPGLNGMNALTCFYRASSPISEPANPFKRYDLAKNPIVYTQPSCGIVVLEKKTTARKAQLRGESMMRIGDGTEKELLTGPWQDGPITPKILDAARTNVCLQKAEERFEPYEYHNNLPIDQDDMNARMADEKKQNAKLTPADRSAIAKVDPNALWPG